MIWSRCVRGDEVGQVRLAGDGESEGRCGALLVVHVRFDRIEVIDQFFLNRARTFLRLPVEADAADGDAREQNGSKAVRGDPHPDRLLYIT